MKSASLILLASFSMSVFAQSSQRFSIARNVFAAGGDTLGTSSRFQLGSTIAQPLAAIPADRTFSILSGFWIWPATSILAPTKTGDNFTLSFQTETGKNYTVQYVDSLTAPNWQSLPSIAGDGSVKTITNSTPGVMQRFFRLLEQ